ncbi:hypothetical protein EVS96_09425 [Salmonella enterica subsp. enterica serovar Muenster]|nr:hypothetical protein [Salmonella enterica subsp. enterica serovar Muenster]
MIRYAGWRRCASYPAYGASETFLTSNKKRPGHKLTGAAKIFSQIRLREVKGLKDRTSYLCTLRE